MINTEAWLLRPGDGADPWGNGAGGFQGFSRGSLELSEPAGEEILVEPLYGSWEANMTHALERQPVDICSKRREEPVVIGNAGVVRVSRPGPDATWAKPGDVCLLNPIGVPDEAGFAKLVHGYDAPGTMGLLAREAKILERNLVRLPDDTPYPLTTWATYGRYWTAWSNWKVAYGCWRTQMESRDQPVPHVWSWGGGVGYAQLQLARAQGARVAMIASTDQRLKWLEDVGITPIDRREFPDLAYDPERYEHDKSYRDRYRRSERAFRKRVQEETDGQGVSIFIDNIGTPVYRATLKVLARQGVITTCGWKHGMELSVLRASECISRRIHVNTHVWRHEEAWEALEQQVVTDWFPRMETQVYAWEDVEQLAVDASTNAIETYFPLYQVNPA